MIQSSSHPILRKKNITNTLEDHYIPSSVLKSFLSTGEKNLTILGFPGGTVVKNLPANAGDTGSSPGSGRSHMPRSNKDHAPQLLSLRSRARVPQLLSPRA